MTSREKRKIIEETAEKLFWQTSFNKRTTNFFHDGAWEKEKREFYVSFERTSPAGDEVELTEFYDRLDDIPGKLYERYTDFDADEYVYGWLEAKRDGVSGVPGVRTLVEDAEWQEQAILDLSIALRDAMNEAEARA